MRASYGRAPFFREYEERIAALYEARGDEERLSDVNLRFISTICALLAITTPITWSTDYGAPAGKNERLIELCRKAGATDYLSGPNARGYLDDAQFAAAGIQVQFADYSGYREYPQPWPPFEHHALQRRRLRSIGSGAGRLGISGLRRISRRHFQRFQERQIERPVLRRELFTAHHATAEAIGRKYLVEGSGGVLLFGDDHDSCSCPDLSRLLRSDLGKFVRGDGVPP